MSSKNYSVHPGDDVEDITDLGEHGRGGVRDSSEKSLKVSVQVGQHSFNRSADIREIDSNKDGVVTKEELESYVAKHHSAVEGKIMFRRLFGASVVVLFIFAGLILGLTYVIVDESRDTEVGNDHEMRSRDSGYMVITENPKVYTAITEIALLPSSAVNALKHLSFATVDGRLHHNEVLGTEMSVSTQNVRLVFAGNKWLDIFNDTATLKETSPSGDYTETSVIITSGSSDELSRRRLQLFEESEDDTHPHWESRRSLADRCSITKGVCYHTFEEMQALNKASRAEQEEATKRGRRLADYGSGSDNVVTYAEISTDTAVLKADSYSDLSQASDFISSLLGAAALDSVNATVVISFTMKERCANYEDLAEECSLSPAPDLNAANDDPTGVLDNLRPFIGLHPEQSKWVFIDEIEYRKDPYTIQLKVRYSHDYFFDRRRHVVMMDIEDPSKIISYDEVEIDYDPENILINLASPTIYYTNYEVVTDLDDQLQDFIDGEEITGRRLLQTADAAFHRHIRANMLAGFPDVFIDDDYLLKSVSSHHNHPHYVAKNGGMRRKLSGDDDDAIDDDANLETVSVTASVTTRYVHGLASIANTTRALASGMITNQTLFDSDYRGTVTNLPAALSNASGYYDDDGAAAIVTGVQATAQEGQVLFDFIELETESGLIQWVDRGDTYEIDEFADTPILQRYLLKQDRDQHAALADLSDDDSDADDFYSASSSSARELMLTLTKNAKKFSFSHLGEQHEALYSYDATRRSTSFAHNDRHQKLSEHMNWLAGFVEQSHRNVVTRQHSRHTPSSGLPLSHEQFGTMMDSTRAEMEQALSNGLLKIPTPSTNAATVSTHDNRVLRTISSTSNAKWTNRMQYLLDTAKDEAFEQMRDALMTEQLEATLAFMTEVQGTVDLISSGEFITKVQPDTTSVYSFLDEMTNMHDSCARFMSLNTELLSAFDAYLTMQEQLNDILATVQDGVADLKDLDTGLGGMVDLKNYLAPTIPAASKIPYGIGVLIKAFYELYSKLISATVKPVSDVVEDIAAQFTNARMAVLTDLQERNIEMGEKVLETQEKLVIGAMKLLILDMVAVITDDCGTSAGTVTDAVCTTLADALEGPVDQINSFKKEMRTQYNFATGVANPVFQVAYEFLNNPVWSALSPVLSFLQSMFDAINTLLNTRITVSIPWVCWRNVQSCSTISYPNGIQYCTKKKWGIKIKYACGTTYGYKR